MTDAQYTAWLFSPDAQRVVIVDAGVNTGGVETVRRLSTRGYVTLPTDFPASTAYLPILQSGLDYKAEIALSAEPSISWGDLDINNIDGQYDAWLDDIWDNRAITARLGDSRWAVGDFRIIYNGIIDRLDIGSSRETLTLKLRDKLKRLNYPLSDVKVGGTGPDKDRLLSLVFGEVHNMSPVLTNNVTYEYAVHSTVIEGLIEIRDNGAPLINTGWVPNLQSGKFTLNSTPVGEVTVSVQGDKKDGTYRNTIASLIKHIVKNHGTEPSQRLLDTDIDLANFTAFDAANPQPVGIVAEGTQSVLDVCSQLAAAVGARLVFNRAGLLQLVQIQIPPPGTALVVDQSRMVEGSFQLKQRLDVLPACKIAFCKNWTVQQTVAAGIPVQHAELFALEWLTASKSNSLIADLWGLYEEPVQEETMLLRRVDADVEATRRLNLRQIRRGVYEFQAWADLLFVELGSPMAVTHPRFGFKNGDRVGQVISLDINWVEARITVGVLM